MKKAIALFGILAALAYGNYAFADSKISALPAVTTPGLTDIIPGVQSGTDYKYTLQQVQGLLFGSTAIFSTTAGVTYTFPGVTASLAPLTSPAFVTDIHSSSAGSATLGTPALPFGSIYLGGAATNNLQITGTSAAARIVNVPDIGATGYVPLNTATTTTVGLIPLSTATAGKGTYGANPALAGETYAAYASSGTTDQGTENINIDGASYSRYLYSPLAGTAAVYTPVITSAPGAGTVRYIELVLGGGTNGVTTITWTNVDAIGTAFATSVAASKYNHYGCMIPTSGHAQCAIIAEGSTY